MRIVRRQRLPTLELSLMPFEKIPRELHYTNVELESIVLILSIRSVYATREGTGCDFEGTIKRAGRSLARFVRRRGVKSTFTYKTSADGQAAHLLVCVPTSRYNIHIFGTELRD